MTEITFEELLYVVENLGGSPGIITVDLEVDKPSPDPLPESIGRLCIVRETGNIYTDTGEDWLQLAFTAPFAGGTLTTALVLSGDATAPLNPLTLQQWQTKAMKDPVTAATTAALPANTRSGNVLTASANGAAPVQDGVTPVVGQSLLVKNEATGANNGLYTWTDVGSAGAPLVLTRRTDADTSAKIASGLIVQIAQGTTLNGKFWRMTNTSAPTLNTTALTFAPVPTDWADLTSKPSTFSPSAHSHAGEDLTSGTVAVARIGTGTKDTTTFYRGDGTFSLPPFAMEAPLKIVYVSPSGSDITGNGTSGNRWQTIQYAVDQSLPVLARRNGTSSYKIVCATGTYDLGASSVTIPPNLFAAFTSTGLGGIWITSESQVASDVKITTTSSFGAIRAFGSCTIDRVTLECDTGGFWAEPAAGAMCIVYTCTVQKKTAADGGGQGIYSLGAQIRSATNASVAGRLFSYGLRAGYGGVITKDSATQPSGSVASELISQGAEIR